MTIAENCSLRRIFYLYLITVTQRVTGLIKLEK